MWTTENRRRYERRSDRYPSDLSGAEWSVIEPMIPPAKRGGRKRTTDMREVVNALLYVLETGCQWRALPKDFPPKTTVHAYLDLRQWDGALARLHYALFVRVREEEGRAASPTAAILDSQSVKGAEPGGGALIPRAMMRTRSSRARSAICSATRSASR